MLELLIRHNDQVVLTPDALTRFHSRAAPGISVVEYLRRIVKYTNMEVSHASVLLYPSIVDVCGGSFMHAGVSHEAEERSALMGESGVYPDTCVISGGQVEGSVARKAVQELLGQWCMCTSG